DLLHWNGDVTNLPARWHEAYLRDCYRDNRLVEPDALEADGTPIDLRLIETPAYVQAGREDHIRSEERRVGKERGARRSQRQAEDGIRDFHVTGVQTCALPI